MEILGRVFLFSLVITACASLSSPVKVTCDRRKPVDGAGVYVHEADKYFDCKYLQQFLKEDEEIGIFNNKVKHCQSPTTDCCATCASILSCQDVGVRLAETVYDCEYLLLDNPKYSKLGIYDNRNWYCDQDKTVTNCFETCKIVQKQEEENTNPANSTTDSWTQTPSQTTNYISVSIVTEPDLIDDCVNDCLYVDGTYGKCEWLMDPDRPEYENRVMFCENGLTRGCRKTCRDVLTEAEMMAVTRSDYLYSRIANDIPTGTDTDSDESQITENGNTVKHKMSTGFTEAVYKVYKHVKNVLNGFAALFQ